MSVRPPPHEFVAFFAPELRSFLEKLSQMRGEARATSWWRSWGDNLRVGGSISPLSQHLAGLAVDVVVQSPTTAADLVGEAFRVGLTAVDEGSHVHIQFWRRGGLNRRLGVPI